MRRMAVLVALGLLLNFAALAGVASAKAPENIELTLQQAVEMAVSNSKSVKSAKYDIDKTSELRDKAGDKVEYTPIDEASTAAETVFTRLQQADRNWQMARRAYEAEQDGVVMRVYKAYDGLLQAAENVKMAEAELKYSNSQRNIALAKSRVGMVNKAELIQAEADVQAKKAGLEAAGKALEAKYEELNLLVGLQPQAKPVLVSTPVFEELQVNDLDYEAQKALEKSPTVWLAQKNVDLAQIAFDIWNYDATGESIKTVKIDLDKAKLSAQNTNDQFKNLVRSLYYSIKQLEEQHAGAQESIRVAEEALRVTKVKYEVGVATAMDVANAEISLEKAKKQVFDILCQHETLTYAFQKPWAYAGA